MVFCEAIWGNLVVHRYDNSSILLYNPLIFCWMDSHPTAAAGMYNRLRYQGLGFTRNRQHSQGTHSHPTATAGKQNAVPRDSVLHHCYSWYSRLQYQGTQCHPTVTAGAVGCSAKSLSLILLFHWVQWAAAPRDSVSSHCHSWYSRLQYEGTLCHHTVIAGAVGCSAKSLSLILLFHWVQCAAAPRDSVSSRCHSWYSRLQYEGTLCHHTVLQLVQQAAISGGCMSWGITEQVTSVGKMLINEHECITT